MEKNNKINSKYTSNKNEYGFLNDFEIVENNNNIKSNSFSNNNNNNNNDSNKSNEIDYNFDMENMTEEDMNNILNSAVKVQEYLDDYKLSEEYQQKKNQELKEIQNLMLQIKQLMSLINIQLNEDDQKLESLEDFIDDSIEQVEKGNKELKKAANDTVDGRKIKYMAALGGTLALLGSFVPGIGNIIGGSLGVYIGHKIAGYEKNKIKKIEDKYSKK
jgi:hypothetical protein